MADRKGEVRAQSQAKSFTLLKKHATIEVPTIDDGDTITVDGIVNIDNAKVVNVADASDVTVNISGNVVTINDVAVSGAHVLCLVVGT
jgi:hypothetical protein